MDANEASKHTQNILKKVNRQQEFDDLASRMVEISSNKPPENSTQQTLEDSDMDTTVLDTNRLSEGLSGVLRQEQELENLSEARGEDLQRSLARTIRYGTPPPTLGISPPTTKLTFGLSKSLENMSLNPSGEKMESRFDLGLGYTNNEFYLPIAACPSVSELEPQLTDKLTVILGK